MKAFFLLLLKISLLVSLGYILFSGATSFAAVVDIPGNTKIQNVSIHYTGGDDAVKAINDTGIRVLTTIKVVIQGLLICMVVYTGFMMIYSMGTDEDTLSNAKRQIWYFLVALLFINIPGTIYEAFYKEGGSVGGSIQSDAFTENSSTNIFVDFGVFGGTINDNIVGFLQIMIFILAIFMLVLQGIYLITSRGREEKLAEAKNKIVYIILALIFVGMIEAWKRLAFTGDISDGVDIFGTLANLALFFAGPVAIFFLTLAGYYYITANGDEEKVHKAKSIIVTTVLATLVLLASYTFLIDLSTLF